MMQLSYPLLDVRGAGEIVTVSVKRPDQLNGLSPWVVHQLQRVFDEEPQYPNVRGIVFAGGDKAFIIGADLGFFLHNLKWGKLGKIVAFTHAGHQLMNTIDRCPKPVVACVAGAALGAGSEVVLACDRVIASPRASFGFPETGLGIYPALGGTQRLARAIGVGLAKWLIFTGKTLSAAEAHRIGLVHRVVPDEELHETARRCALGELVEDARPERSPELLALERFFLAHRADDLRAGRADTGGDPALTRAMKLVATKGPVALRVAERLIGEGSRRTLDEGLQMEIDHVVEVYRTEDAHRGLTFRVNRQVGQPDFIGR